jgi:tRNA G18 (ribose-2'-O)-methylase SpoU
MRKRRRDVTRSHEIGLIWSKRAPLGPYPLILVLDGLKASFNVGKIVRSANALGCREVFLVGIAAWDPVLARGALEETRTRTFATMNEAMEALRTEGYTVYALHPKAETAVGGTPFPEKSAFVVGHEGFGLSVELSAFPDMIPLRVPQVGAIESMNVAVAASIAAYDYLRERKLLGTASVGNAIGNTAKGADHPATERVRAQPAPLNLP